MAFRWAVVLGVVGMVVAGCTPVDGGADGGADGGSRICGEGLACNPTCTSAAQCGVDEVCTGGFCGRAPPTSGQFAACALDGDCPRSDSCKLGACSHECLSDSDCASGTVCASRGRCVAPEVVTQPPAVSVPSKGSPQLAPSSLSFTSQTQSTATVVLSNGGGEPFDFRVLSSSPAFSVAPFEGRVSGQPVTLTVSLNRSALAGSDTAFLMVNTTAGPKRLPISVAAGVDGLWIGTFQVESPVALGENVASFNLTADATGQLSGMVVGESSPLWPANAKVSGSMAPADGGVQAVSFSFRIVAPQGTAPNPAVPATVERTVTVSGARVEGGGIQGTFAEVIHGLVGAELRVKGTVALRRAGLAAPGTPLPDSTGTVGAVADPFVDSGGAAKGLYAQCETACPGGCVPADPVENGNRYFNATSASGTKVTKAFYEEFKAAAGYGTADQCVTGTTGPCENRKLYDSVNLYCAQYWYAKVVRTGTVSAVGNLLDTLEIPADAALYEGNAAIAKAFDSWYSAGLAQQESILTRAHLKLLSGLYSTAATPIAFADPGMATYLSGFSATSLTQPRDTTTGDVGDRGLGEELRRAVLVVNNLMFVADQRSYLLRKMGDTAAATTRLREGVVTGYLAIEALGPALAKSTTWDVELAATRTNWHQLMSDLSEVEQGRNALGYAPGYVPFFWNKDSAGTNYMQIKAQADANIQLWMNSYGLAQSWARQFESSQQALSEELSAQKSTVLAQFREVCGASATSVEDCGADYGGDNASQMAQAKLDYMGTVTRVQQAATQMSNLYREIKIEQDRAAAVAGVHQNNAKLIRETGDQVMVLDVIEGEINIHQQIANELLSTAQQATSGAPWSVAGTVFGVAKAAVNAICGEQKLVLEQAKARLALDERSRIEFSVGQVELINSAAAIASKNLQIDSLLIESSLAYINLAQSKGRINALYERAQALLDASARATALSKNKGAQVLHSRIFASSLAMTAANDQRKAVEWAYLATRALEYQLNTSLDQSRLWQARSPVELGSYIGGVLAEAAAKAGTAQTRVDVISLRDKVLGLNTPIRDVATGQTISAKERFRRFVMDPRNRDENGNFHIQFLTNDSANPLFSSLLASDRIRGVKMNLIGDNLGPGLTTVDVQLIHGGTSYLRAMTRDASGVARLTAYDVSGKLNQPRVAAVQAGVNTPAAALRENPELQERAVLAGPWQLIIDQSPANANLNLAGLDDIEITLTHDAYTIQ